jgi:SWIM/SEC-C metal-binding protein
MSKMFYKGKIERSDNTGSAGFNTKAVLTLGTKKCPLELNVKDEARQTEVQAQADAQDVVVNITIDAELDENIQQLTDFLSKPKSVTIDKVPARNEPCLCGSGKKYKKCCG